MNSRSAAVVLGAACGKPDSEAHACLDRYAKAVGLAFQVIDDVLDAESSTATLGKTAGKDAKAGKTTFVKLHGLETSRRLAQQSSDSARAALRELPGDTAFLLALIESMAARTS